eukprot:TRINITY_DN11579_c1_g1_i1.p1 TRINITY_DN11579_c1_g1~~TRINITY_DN11579_c1_g1_i1.p1  ORF type:complete len:566 (+),score=75.13 TRINITY_DN11579_c1_g1_i1:91-1698(+)
MMASLPCRLANAVAGCVGDHASDAVVAALTRPRSWRRFPSDSASFRSVVTCAAAATGAEPTPLAPIMPSGARVAGNFSNGEDGRDASTRLVVQRDSNDYRRPRLLTAASAWRRRYVKLNECADRGDLRNAELVFSEIAADTPGHSIRLAFNTMLKACAHSGNFTKACEWYERMLFCGVTPNIKSFGKMIDAAAKSGNLAAARQWYGFALLNVGGQCPDLLGLMMIDACAEAGLPEEAAAWLVRLKAADIPLDVIAYNSVLKAFARLDVEAAEAAEVWLRKMCAACVVPNTISYNIIIDVNVRARRMTDAVQWYERLCAAGLRPTALSFSTLIRGFVQHAKADDAAAWLSKMSKAQIQPEAATYNAVMNAFATDGDHRGAIRWLHAMTAENVTPDLISYNTVLKALARAGRAEEAVGWLSKCEDARHVPSIISFTSAIGACSRAKPPRPDLSEYLYRRAAIAGCIDVSTDAAVIGSHGGGPPLRGSRRFAGEGAGSLRSAPSIRLLEGSAQKALGAARLAELRMELAAEAAAGRLQ